VFLSTLGAHLARVGARRTESLTILLAKAAPHPVVGRGLGLLPLGVVDSFGQMDFYRDPAAARAIVKHLDGVGIMGFSPTLIKTHPFAQKIRPSTVPRPAYGNALVTKNGR
jgi:hypothetical protein